ncbi:MAG: chorismate mutase [Treponema sp.]|nr:chorismate mutase [Treponema sp.]
MSKVCAVRGAVTCENTKESITEAVQEMCNLLFLKNHLNSSDLISIQFTMTKDLDEYNAARALRDSQTCIDCSETALFVSQEAFIKGGMEKVIRVLITCCTPDDFKPVNIYLRDAQKLRPDRKIS